MDGWSGWRSGLWSASGPETLRSFGPFVRWAWMRVFLDFEASSLSKLSFPIEVGWVFEDGRSESHLIRPAGTWADWDPASEAIHRIDRRRLELEGIAHDVVAARMIAALTGHELLAGAPSWDGKWLSVLLRAAGLPRHSLRLTGTGEAVRKAIRAILGPGASGPELEALVDDLVARSNIHSAGHVPAHRALPDALDERARFLSIVAAARKLAADRRWAGGEGG